jgi:hypothetical protein
VLGKRCGCKFGAEGGATSLLFATSDTPAAAEAEPAASVRNISADTVLIIGAVALAPGPPLPTVCPSPSTCFALESSAFSL